MCYYIITKREIKPENKNEKAVIDMKKTLVLNSSEEFDVLLDKHEDKALAKLKADCIKKAVENEKQGVEKAVQGLYKKTRTGIKTAIVDNNEMFEYYTNKGYGFYCCPTFADILKYADSKLWEK
jgi:hypothetical protein